MVGLSDDLNLSIDLYSSAERTTNLQRRGGDAGNKKFHARPSADVDKLKAMP